MNNVTLEGRVAQDPDLRYTPGGKSVIDLRVASDVGYGEKKKAIFIDCTFWHKTAEFCGKYLKKGDRVFVIGELDCDHFETKEGYKRTKWRIQGRDITPLWDRGGNRSQQEMQFAAKEETEDAPF